jgi:hypothetical protein
MDTIETISFTWQCPRCSKPLSPSYNTTTLKTFLERGEPIGCMCIDCYHHWALRPGPQAKADLATLLAH